MGLHRRLNTIPSPIGAAPLTLLSMSSYTEQLSLQTVENKHLIERWNSGRARICLTFSKERLVSADLLWAQKVQIKHFKSGIHVPFLFCLFACFC